MARAGQAKGLHPVIQFLKRASRAGHRHHIPTARAKLLGQGRAKTA